MPQLPRFDHVGITVTDLEAVTAFFAVIGLAPEGEPQIVEGEFVSTVVGIEDVRVENVMLSLPDGGTKLELSRFLNPVEGHPPQEPPATRPGLCNICFEVEDLRAVVNRAKAHGYDVVGGIADYEGIYRMCYLRGPEGIIVSLAQFIG